MALSYIGNQTCTIICSTPAFNIQLRLSGTVQAEWPRYLDKASHSSVPLRRNNLVDWDIPALLSGTVIILEFFAFKSYF